MKKYISSFISGFGAGVLQIVPVLKNLACCALIPIASYIAILLDRRANHDNGKMSLKKGLMIGLITGLYAAVFGSIFDLLITFITRNNDFIFAISQLQKVMNDFPLNEKLKQEVMTMITGVARDIQQYGFSALYTVSIIMNNFIINSIFGIVGGLISSQIINSRINSDNSEF